MAVLVEREEELLKELQTGTPEIQCRGNAQRTVQELMKSRFRVGQILADLLQEQKIKRNIKLLLGNYEFARYTEEGDILIRIRSGSS